MCRIQDLDQVVRLEKVSFPEDAYSKSVFFYFFVTERDGFIVARKGELVVGYVIATSREGQGMIQSIAVSPQFRRKGVGTLLMQSAVAQLARKFTRVYLQVDADQEGTIRFYRNLSFGETGRVIKRYYPNGHDAIEMVRQIRP